MVNLTALEDAVKKMPPAPVGGIYEDDLDFSKIEEVLPVPAGYKILVAVPRVAEKTAGGVIKTSDENERERTAAIIGMVIRLGKDAYGDKVKFPNGPWCAQGDWVMLRSYAGHRMLVGGNEMRLVNDDSVEAIVPDPRAIKRVGSL